MPTFYALIPEDASRFGGGEVEDVIARNFLTASKPHPGMGPGQKGSGTETLQMDNFSRNWMLTRRNLHEKRGTAVGSGATSVTHGNGSLSIRLRICWSW